MDGIVTLCNIAHLTQFNNSDGHHNESMSFCKFTCTYKHVRFISWQSFQLAECAGLQARRMLLLLLHLQPPVTYISVTLFSDMLSLATRCTSSCYRHRHHHHDNECDNDKDNGSDCDACHCQCFCCAVAILAQVRRAFQLKLSAGRPGGFCFV